MLSAPFETIGLSGTGAFTQSGGTNSVAVSLVLAQGASSTGTYNLNGGLLSVGSLTQGSGSATFNFSGGTLQALSSFSTSLPIVLSTAGSNGIFNTSGNTLTLAGPLSGPGGIRKIGAGMLTLSGADTYTGSTTVSAGTLIVQGGNSSSSFTAANGGTLKFAGASVNLGFGYVQAAAGGNVQYQNTTFNGGFIRGPGTHTLLAGSISYFNGTTINNGAVVQQNGTANFTDATNAGQINNNANSNLIWQGGSNASSGKVIVNNSATVNVSEWYNDGIVTVNNGGLLNNSVSDLVSGGGGQIYVNSGGTLNADSNAEGVALDLQDSLLVNNGTIAGTTNVYYGATAQGSGTFGLINVYEGGTLLISPSYGPVAPAAVVSGGSIAGAGTSALPITTDGAYLAATNATDRLAFSGDFSGSGSITKLGAGAVVLSGTNTYQGGTIVLDGTLIASNNEALGNGSNLSVGTDLSAYDSVISAQDSGSAAAPAVAPVPEPGTLALAAAALGIVAATCAARKVTPNKKVTPNRKTTAR